MRLIKSNTSIDFVALGRYAVIVSAVVLLASIGSLLVGKLTFGIDFTGGTLIEVQAKQGEADIGNIRERLAQAGIADPQVQEFGTDREALIRIGSAGEVSDASQQSLVDNASQAIAADYDIRRT